VAHHQDIGATLGKKLKKKQKLIEFIPWKPDVEGLFSPPVPASSMLPDWYRGQSMYVDGQKAVTEKGDINHTVKACMPVLDAMTAGYIIPLPQDLSVEIEPSGERKYRWPSDVLTQISSHSLGQVSSLPIESGVWSPEPMKLNNPWIIKTPPGYSTLFLHPLWREDLPFRCFSGFVDTDTYNFNPVNFPFLIKNDFCGIIPAGTPMIQAIPIKRTSFVSMTADVSDPEWYKNWQKTRVSFGHRYKNRFRQKKEYK